MIYMSNDNNDMTYKVAFRFSQSVYEYNWSEGGKWVDGSFSITSQTSLALKIHKLIKAANKRALSLSHQNLADTDTN